MRLLVDAQLPRRLAAWLREQGHLIRGARGIVPYNRAMDKATHRIYERLPDTVPMPVRLRNRRAEVVILPLAPKGGRNAKRRRKVLAAAWGSVKPTRRLARIDRDIAAMRDEWGRRS